MRAIRKSKAAPGLDLVDVPKPKPAKGEVLVKVRSNSVCGTDLHIYNWDEWAQQRISPPLIVGHEVAGEITAVGAGVDNKRIGEYVSIESHFPDQTCPVCKNGSMHLCQNMHLFGVDRAGGFAEFATAPALCAWNVGDDIEHDYASLLEPLGNAVYLTQVESVKDKIVTIFGCGPVGLFSTAIAKHCGARQVIAIEPNDYRQDLVRKAGADVVIDPSKEDAVERVMAETDGMGSEIVYEVSGNDLAIGQATEILRSAGSLCFFGITRHEVKLDITNDIIFKGARIYGITGRRMFETWESMRSLLREGLDIKPLITHSVPFERFDDAFKLMNEGQCGKVRLDVS